jgi:hypothetical protein
VARTDDIPLFIEELTKALLEGTLLREEENGHYVLTGPKPSVAISSSLQDFDSSQQEKWRRSAR